MEFRNLTYDAYLLGMESGNITGDEITVTILSYMAKTAIGVLTPMTTWCTDALMKGEEARIVFVRDYHGYYHPIGGCHVMCVIKLRAH